MAPYESLWRPDLVERLHGEIYQSDVMLEAHEEISKLPHLMDDTLERVVAPLMVWSDSTQLANFGTASLWPFYLYFGNQSKYTHGKPTANACHHLVYLPTVSFFFCLVTIIEYFGYVAFRRLPGFLQNTIWEATIKASPNSLQKGAHACRMGAASG